MNCMSRRSATPSGAIAAQETVVVADIVGEFGGTAHGAHEPVRALCVFGAFHHGGGAHVAEDEMTIAVAPFEMAGSDLGVDDQRLFHRAGADHVGGSLNAEGGRGAGDVHVKRKAARADGVLNFDANGGIARSMLEAAQITRSISEASIPA